RWRPLPPSSANGDQSSPWAKAPLVAAPPPSDPVDGVVSITIPAEILADPNPLWRCYAVGYFIGDAPHIGSIHATVNRLWSSPKTGNKIVVQFLEKNIVLFRIENTLVRERVIQRRYWHISDVPLVVNKWSLETALDPQDLSAMPIWIDLKGVPSMLFSHKALKCLSRAARKFVKLHPSTERCTRIDVARVLVEVNVQAPLVEKIICLDKDGLEMMIDMSYPWLPPQCNVCDAWGHKGVNCTSNKIRVLQNGKEIVEETGDTEVVINGEGKVRYELDKNRNVVNELLLELEDLPPALGSDVVGDVSRKAFEVGGISLSASELVAENSELDWALVGGKSPQMEAKRTEEMAEGNDDNQEEDEDSKEEGGVEEVEELEEGEVDAGEQKESTKLKDVAKSVRLRTNTSLKLSKQFPARAKDTKFQAKLKLLKYDMRMLNKTHYGDLPRRTKLAFEE
ncbi:hypothetical protein HID58_044832, partial [Brassica napus]